MTNPITPGSTRMPCGTAVFDEHVDLHTRDCDVCREVNSRPITPEDDTRILECLDCHKRTMGYEAEDRIFNTGKCAFCGGELLESKADDSQDWTPKKEEHYQIVNKLCDDFYDRFDPAKMNVKTFATFSADYIQANYLPKSQVEAELDKLEASIPIKDGEAVTLQFDTHEQIRFSSNAIQDNGKIMAVKEIRTKLGLATPEKEEKQHE